MTAEEMLAIMQADWEADLAGWAASEAAKILAQNWADALNDGANLPTLMRTDIPNVVAILKRWAFLLNLSQFVKPFQKGKLMSDPKRTDELVQRMRRDNLSPFIHNLLSELIRIVTDYTKQLEILAEDGTRKRIDLETCPSCGADLWLTMATYKQELSGVFTIVGNCASCKQTLEIIVEPLEVPSMLPF